MATYFKYAERSAESQVNWAEIGKNMTDMLQNEDRIREQKKAAIDEATRAFGEELANAPQGEHKGINQWALEYGDNASQYMLMQERLLKSGAMNLRDYTIGRQNLVDGTKQAFELVKEFNASYAEKMERYKKNESQDIEVWLNGQAEKFGDFTKSQLYINPTNGTVSVAMRELQTINGQQVYTMNKNPNEFTTINALRNNIKGKYDRFDTNAVTTAFAESLGKEQSSSIIFGTLSRGGVITSVEDITTRVDIDPETKKVMFKFIEAENQMIDAALSNPFNRLSVLTNSKKFAPNGKQYTFTYDEKDAKANPEKILIKVDPATGAPSPEFSAEQMKESQKFMRNEARAKYTSITKQDATGQAQLQERRPRTEGEMNEQERRREARIFGENLAMALKGTDPTSISNAVRYLANKSGKIVNRTKDGFVISNSDGTNRSIFNFTADGRIANPNELSKNMISAFGTRLPEDEIIRVANSTLSGRPIERTTSAQGFEPSSVDVSTINIPKNIFTSKSKASSTNLQSILPKGFSTKEETGTFGLSNDVVVTAPNGNTYIYNSNLSASKVDDAKAGLEEFVKTNNVSATTTAQPTTTTPTNTTVKGGNER